MDTLSLITGIGLGMAATALLWPRSRKGYAGFRAEPLPCVLFPRDFSAAQRVQWLRWMADRLEATSAQEEGGDEPR